MKQQIARISPSQTAKMFGLLSFVLSLPVMAVELLPLINSGTGFKLRAVSGLMLATPFLYAVAGFVIALFAAVLYNLVARLVGGLEFTVEETGGAPTAVEG
jgi:hypothetical protein